MTQKSKGELLSKNSLNNSTANLSLDARLCCWNACSLCEAALDGCYAESSLPRETQSRDFSVAHFFLFPLNINIKPKMMRSMTAPPPSPLL